MTQNDPKISKIEEKKSKISIFIIIIFLGGGVPKMSKMSQMSQKFQKFQKIQKIQKFQNKIQKISKNF